jgi:hypothetical protein
MSTSRRPWALHTGRAASARNFVRNFCEACTSALVAVEVAIAVVSPNVRAHYWARAKRTKRERAEVRRALEGRAAPPLPAAISLCRVGPRRLDDDNLAGALKGVRDQVSAWLGVDDADPRVVWRYEQARGTYAVRITVTEVRP